MFLQPKYWSLGLRFGVRSQLHFPYKTSPIPQNVIDIPFDVRDVWRGLLLGQGDYVLPNMWQVDFDAADLVSHIKASLFADAATAAGVAVVEVAAAVALDATVAAASQQGGVWALLVLLVVVVVLLVVVVGNSGAGGDFFIGFFLFYPRHCFRGSSPRSHL